METTQKPQEETFRIHDPEEKRRHIRQEASSEAQPKRSAVKTEQNRRSAEAKKRKPEKTAAKKTVSHKRTTDGKTASQKQPVPRKKVAAKPDPDDISNKKRVYGKTKPKKKSAIATFGASLKKKSASKKMKKSAQNKQPTPAVIYTQPQAFNRNRLLVQLLTVVAVVAALVLGLSVFFKVEKITVTGAEVYSAWAIREASGISEGDNLLTFSRARAGAQIRAALPYVDKVRIGIKLPETVIIYIEELSVAYAIKSSDGDWWLINSDGRVVEQVDGVDFVDRVQILNEDRKTYVDVIKLSSKGLPYLVNVDITEKTRDRIV